MPQAVSRPLVLEPVMRLWLVSSCQQVLHAKEH